MVRPDSRLNASSEHDIDTVFATLAQQHVDAPLIDADASLSHPDQLVALVARLDLREFAPAGSHTAPPFDCPSHAYWLQSTGLINSRRLNHSLR